MTTLRLGPSLVIKGQLAASEDLTVYGPFEGTIEVPDHIVTVGRHSHIDGAILAKNVIIEGRVDGDVTAGEWVEIRDSGQLHGDLVSPRLTVADGASVHGTVKTLLI